MLPIWAVVLIALVFAILGAVGGFFYSRTTIKDYMAKNPPIDAKMIRAMYMQMGISPSTKKVNQVVAAMKNSSEKEKAYKAKEKAAKKSEKASKKK